MRPTVSAICAILSNPPPSFSKSFVGRKQLLVAWARRLVRSKGARGRRIRGPRARPLDARRLGSHGGCRQLRRHNCLHSMSNGQCLLNVLLAFRVGIQSKALFGAGPYLDIWVCSVKLCTQCCMQEFVVVGTRRQRRMFNKCREHVDAFQLFG